MNPMPKASEVVLFDRVVSALHDAMFDDAHWPKASALVDRVCASKGNIIVWGEGGLGSDLKTFFSRCCYGGERHEEFEQEYFGVFHHVDERGPRLRRLPDSKIVSVKGLYTREEKRSSVAYNEMLARSDTANCLHARLNGPDGTRIIWTAADPVDDVGWSSARVRAIGRLLPHIRQFVRVRQALAEARALGATMSQLLENTRCGIVQLDSAGRIVAVNPRALKLLRQREALSDVNGNLRARVRREDDKLQKLLKRALPGWGGAAPGSGSMTVTRPPGLPPRLVLHVSPVGDSSPGCDPTGVAAIVLVIEPETRTVADPELIAETLGLTAAESRVAGMLAEGHSLRGIAAATGRSTGTVRWHVRQIYEKNGISRQTELVQLVRSLSLLTRGRG